MSNRWIQGINIAQVIAAIAVIGFIATPRIGWGQVPDPNVADLRIDASVADLGIGAAQRGDYVDSVELLAPLFEKTPGYTTDQGIVGYWFGHALLEVHTPRSALHAWHRTLRTLDKESAAWTRTADAFVRATFETGTTPYYEVATQTYLELLEQAGQTDAAPERVQTAVQQHVLETVFVLPDAMKSRIGLAPEQDVRLPSDLTLNESAGEVLAAWWRKQDRNVASASNERLIEHLTRVAEARRAYMPDGYIDARGGVYIRLGPPPITLDVTFADYPVMQREVIRSMNSITSFDFPPGIYWEYDELGTEAHFLFVESEEGDAYELGTVTDMIPRHIRSNFSGRSEKTYAYLRSMEVALRQLSVYNPRYMGRYAEVENYIAYLKTGGGIDFATPGEQAVRVEQHNTIEDHRLKRIRREAVGVAQSDVDANYPALNVQMRWARFLEDDGTTRTEIYWTLPTNVLTPHEAIDADALNTDDMEIDPGAVPEASRVVASTRLEDRQHQAIRQATSQVEVSGALSGEWLSGQTLTISVNETPFHLGVQWDQRLGGTAEEAGNLLLRQSTARIDTLNQLSNDPSAVEMSDVKLVQAHSDSLAAGIDETALHPYPLQQARKNTPLGIYFEVYHLMLNENDQARYTIDLNADRVQPRQGIARWMRSDEEQQTTTTITNETTGRRVNELFLLDIAAWEDIADEEEVTLTVRVTDNVSGQSVERNVQLSIVQDVEE